MGATRATSTGSEGRPATRVWTGAGFCHAPADRPVDLERLADPGDASDRWNEPGDPTIYLAADAGVALAEFARHHAPDDVAERRLLCLRLRPLELVDLTDAATRVDVGAPGGPDTFLDRSVAREVAARLRSDGRWSGLLVPSMAFLDDPTRCNLVLFPEHLPGGIRGSLEGWLEVGRLVVDRAQSPRTTGG